MSDSNEHVGFSFQLSETPPPADVTEGTPLGDLDLDFGDFTNGSEDASPAALDLRNRSWVGEEGLKPAPQEDPQNEVPLSSAAISRSAAPTSIASQSAPHPSSPQSETGASTPAALQRAEQTASRSVPGISRPSEMPNAVVPLPPSPAEEPVPVAAPAEKPSAPRIKKIQFPVPADRVKRAVSSGKAARSTNTQHAPVPKISLSDGATESAPAAQAETSRPKTRFSKSISAKSPRARLESDAEGERGTEMPQENHATSAPGKTKTKTHSAPGGDQSPPEDLPSSSDPYLPEQGSMAEWGTDTPSAREIWQKARKSWQETSRHALTLGGQGLRASQRLAVTMNGRVRESLRRAAEERKTVQEEHAARAREEQALKAAPDASEGGRVADFHSVASRASSPSMAGRVILGLARSAGKKLAAPLSAVAAAGLVYYAGTHLLAAGDTPGLSKSVSGAEVPDLGTLAMSKSKKAEGKPKTDDGDLVSTSASEKKKSEPEKEPPMQVEVTEMPQGLSWPGKGLIEVVTSEEELIYVDGVFTGRGPLRRIPVSPGKHEVSIRTESSQRSGTVEVTANRNSRAVFKSN